MKINTTTQHDHIAKLFQQNASTLTKPEQQVLIYLKDFFLENAEASALTFAPDERTHFLYREPIASSQFEALSSEVTNALAEADITFVKNTGTGFHTIKADFPVVKS